MTLPHLPLGEEALVANPILHHLQVWQGVGNLLLAVASQDADEIPELLPLVYLVHSRLVGLHPNRMAGLPRRVDVVASASDELLVLLGANHNVLITDCLILRPAVEEHRVAQGLHHPTEPDGLLAKPAGRVGAGSETLRHRYNVESHKKGAPIRMRR